MTVALIVRLIIGIEFSPLLLVRLGPVSGFWPLAAITAAIECNVIALAAIALAHELKPHALRFVVASSEVIVFPITCVPTQEFLR